jgi:hypothetical protein
MIEMEKNEKIKIHHLPLILVLVVVLVSCATEGGGVDVTVESDFYEYYWEDVVNPDGPEFGLGSRDSWQLSQDGPLDLSCTLRNDCGGCSLLQGTPNTDCDDCGGKWECDGPEAVKCVGGCDEIGCSDGEREGFTDIEKFPEIAGCAGAWDVRGLLNPETGGVIPPMCGRMTGDDHPVNSEGYGCSASDLCANGWRICSSPRDVYERTRYAWDKGCGTDSDWPPATFFAAAVSGAGGNECSIGVNDIFGCGSAGDSADPETCYPLTKYSDDKCDALPSGWDCGEGYLTTNLTEAKDVKKTRVEGGGVLCCKERR